MNPTLNARVSGNQVGYDFNFAVNSYLYGLYAKLTLVDFCPCCHLAYLSHFRSTQGKQSLIA